MALLAPGRAAAVEAEARWDPLVALKRYDEAVLRSDPVLNFWRSPQRPEATAPAVALGPVEAEAALVLVLQAGDRAFGEVCGKKAIAAAAARAAELEGSELGRLRGRVELGREGVGGAFESGGVQAATERLLQGAPEAPGYQAYCRWRAYGEALDSAGQADRAAFAAAFGQALLAALPVPPPPGGPAAAGGRPGAAALREGLRALLEGCVAAKLFAKWELDLGDEVDVELWQEGALRTLKLSVVVEGDPFEDAQVVLAERRDSVAPSRGAVVPDAAQQVLRRWLQGSLPRAQVVLDSYYAGMRYSSVLGLGGPGRVRVQVLVTS